MLTDVVSLANLSTCARGAGPLCFFVITRAGTLTLCPTLREVASTQLTLTADEGSSH